jgi:hypothetical protein
MRIASGYKAQVRSWRLEVRTSQNPHPENEPVKKQLGRMLRGRVQELFVRRGCYD